MNQVMEEDHMKQTSKKTDVAKFDSKNVEVVNKSSSTPSSGSIGKDIAWEILKTVGPPIGEGIKTILVEEYSERKANKQDMRAELQEEHKLYMELIRKEEENENSNQEKLDRLYARLDMIKQERKDIDEKSHGFIKGLLKSLKDFIPSKSETK